MILKKIFVYIIIKKDLLMKKVIIGILLITVIVVICFSTWYNRNLQKLKDIKNFNDGFNEYINKEITGTELTTVLNKALENNNKNKIEKNQDGIYIDNGENSIEVLVKPSKEGSFYSMEAFEKVGMLDFTKNFGGFIFKSIKVEYHSNGRISKIFYEIQE